MITIKNESEFRKMAVAGACVAAVHEAVVEAAQVGVTLRRLDEVAASVIRSRGCKPSFLGYQGFPAHICASPNEVVVHGIPGKYRLRSGDILSIDAGAIYEGYHGDAALTFGIGDIDEDAARLLDVTRRALWAGIDQVRVGNRVGDLGHAVEQAAAPHGYGVVRDYVGHGIGRAMHEPPQIPNYGVPGRGLRLRRGMAVCIEPMFNLGTEETRTMEDGWTVVTADGMRSAHFEHTVALTADGPTVTTVSDLLTARPVG
ncbi:MAG: type I methionyl aminopeptidase [bacterium]|nr:type I methionyl aminopeptidase [bacterium]